METSSSVEGPAEGADCVCRASHDCRGRIAGRCPLAKEPLVPANTFFVSSRLWYRAAEASDAPLLSAWRNDPQIRRTTGRSFPVAESTVREAVIQENPWRRGQVNDHAAFVFGLKGSVQPIGPTALFHILWIERSAEFGVAIAPEHWNKGYGREVAQRMLLYAFDELNLNRVELWVDRSNLRGVKAYTAAGFVLEGTKRHAAFSDGRWEDLLLMGALCTEWRTSVPERSSD